MIWRHAEKQHGGWVLKFRMNVTFRTFGGDAMLRQITEVIRISEVTEKELINTKMEWKDKEDDNRGRVKERRIEE